MKIVYILIRKKQPKSMIQKYRKDVQKSFCAEKRDGDHCTHRSNSAEMVNDGDDPKESEEDQKMMDDDARESDDQKASDNETKESDTERRASDDYANETDEDQRASDEDKRVSDDDAKESNENQKMSDDDAKGSDENQKASDDDAEGSDESQKMSDDEAQGCDENQKASDDDAKGSDEDQRASDDDSKDNDKIADHATNQEDVDDVTITTHTPLPRLSKEQSNILYGSWNKNAQRAESVESDLGDDVFEDVLDDDDGVDPNYVPNDDTGSESEWEISRPSTSKGHGNSSFSRPTTSTSVDPNCVPNDTDGQSESEWEISRPSTSKGHGNSSFSRPTTSTSVDPNCVPNHTDSQIEISQPSTSKGPATSTFSRDEFPSEDSEPDERELTVDECIYDRTHTSIYTRLLQKSFMSKDGKAKKLDRVYNVVHACVYCHKLFTNIQTHLLNRHSCKEQVKQIRVLQSTMRDQPQDHSIKKEIKSKQDLLRFHGDHIHNTNVMKKKRGELLLSRTTRDGTFNADDYGPCPCCMEWFKLENNMWKHQQTCPCKTGDTSSKLLLLQASILTGKLQPSGSKKLKSEVFPIMKRDVFTEAAQQDPLITALGDVWLSKSMDNALKRKYYTSFRMRLSGRLLHMLRKKLDTPGTNTMSECLKPANFDLMVETALDACYTTMDDTEELKHPSTALKLGFDIQRLASAKLAFSIKNNNEFERKEAMDFLQLMKLEWGVRVTKLARVIINQRHFNKKNPLPKPGDLQKLAEYSKQELLSIDYSQHNAETFRRCVILSQTRLLVFNKRRSGELEAMTVSSYEKRSTGVDDVEEGLRQDLSPLEKHLLETQDLVEIRGKNGKAVPVLIPNDAKEALEFISRSSIRKSCGIRAENTYLFANTILGVVRGYDALKIICHEADLTAPERITSINLRKYIATMTQVLSLDKHQMDWLCRHLGHSQKIHKIHYRSTSGTIERVEIAKLMMLQDYNLLGKYSGKKLEEIQFEELVDYTTTDSSQERYSEPEDQIRGANGADEEDVLDDMLEDVEDDGLPPAKRKSAKRVRRVNWTKEEEKEIEQLFEKCLRGRKCPKRADCEAAMAASRVNDGIIWKRYWETLKKKVFNMIKNKK